MDSDKVSHYRILEKLGAGGMGEVYLAEDLKLGRKVAIKILSEEFTTNRDRLSRFELEASAASALNHPNILTIHEVGVDEGRHYIATEYIDGVTLRRKTAAGHLEIREILDIAVQIASALEEAHGVGIVHRDIKPDNIMIRRNGFVKVLDFGLAKLTENTTDRSPSDAEASTRVLVQTDAGVVMGTSHYMSPEQARGKQVDVRSDIWSLGVVIYEMVTGHTPFEGETPTDVIVSITQKEPPPLARFAPDAPPELDWIVTKALRKDREERYQTIKEVLTDLRRLKQRVEFELEVERSTPPDSYTRSLASGRVAPTMQDKALPTAEKTVSHLSSAEYIVGGIKRHKVAALVALIIVAVIASGSYFYFKRKPALTTSDTVLLTEFINTTGESVFDGTLKQALAVQLGQTPFLNIFPDDRVRETLRFMGRSPDERITKEVGKEICERQGIKAMLVGSIASLGSHYVITLEALNARSGDPIAREQVEADSKEKVLSSLGTAASSLRKKLGESLSSIKQYDVAIEQATTSSLEALKAYAMGNEERNKGKVREALALYQRAVDLDPNFAMAYARIAVFYGNQSQFESAKEYVQKAYDLRDRVSEREKLYITEKYYNYVTGEMDKAMETQQTWSKLYPTDFIPHNNLALNYLYFGRYDEALKEALEAVRLSPNNVSARENLIGSFLGLERIDEAEQANNELLKTNPDYPGAHFNSYLFAFLRGDQARMTQETEWGRGKLEEAEMSANLAWAETFSGKFKKGEELAKQSVDMYLSRGAKENAANTLMTLSATQALVGKCDVAKGNVQRALTIFKGRMSMAGGATTLAACGDAAKSQALLDEVVKEYPKDLPVTMISAPLVRALIERDRGNLDQAIQYLEPLHRYDLGIIAGLANNYARGLVLLEQKKGVEATVEFKKILEHRTIDFFSPVHALAQLQLARSAAANGDVTSSKKYYQDFFAAWRDADQDLPVLVTAKNEYEKIK
jgi:serine/threonine protein kinase/tetratricopeptide (TPR) repeat protein